LLVTIQRSCKKTTALLARNKTGFQPACIFVPRKKRVFACRLLSLPTILKGRESCPTNFPLGHCTY
jgi:hypothetical protein